MIIEGASFATAASESLRCDRGKGWIRHVTANTDPDLPVLLIEDVADMAGLALAFAGSALAAVTGCTPTKGTPNSWSALATRM